MVTFLLCLALLVVAYFVCGRLLERIVGADPTVDTPCKRLYDGVDYVPLPRWRIFLIQLLNIAGLGPIFGALLGAAYGPVAFLWITFGGIFIGAMHDFISGFISLRHDGASLPEIVGLYLGNDAKHVMRVFSIGLLILVGAVFTSQPAALIAQRIDKALYPAVEQVQTTAAEPVVADEVAAVDPAASVEPAAVTEPSEPAVPFLRQTSLGGMSWLLLIVMGVIILYYIAATLLPIDTIIGRFYPLFGMALLIMALGILFVLLFGGRYTIPELTSLANFKTDAEHFPIMPMLFTTIACGAISGFHATQSPLMARCLANERHSRSIFYGAMISESIIALIWAAIGMAFWGGLQGLNAAIEHYHGAAAVMVDVIATETLGKYVSPLVILGVVACAITSGDTVFRSARLIIADILGVEQHSMSKRVMIAAPLFAMGLIMIFCLPFQSLWNYFAWMNQALATITLYMIFSYLWKKRRRAVWVVIVPAIFMTYVCSSYVFISPLMCGIENHAVAYGLATAATVLMSVLMLIHMRRGEKRTL